MGFSFINRLNNHEQNSKYFCNICNIFFVLSQSYNIGIVVMNFPNRGLDNSCFPWIYLYLIGTLTKTSGYLNHNICLSLCVTHNDLTHQTDHSWCHLNCQQFIHPSPQPNRCGKWCYSSWEFSFNYPTLT